MNRFLGKADCGDYFEKEMNTKRERKRKRGNMGVQEILTCMQKLESNHFHSKIWGFNDQPVNTVYHCTILFLQTLKVSLGSNVVYFIIK